MLVFITILSGLFAANLSLDGVEHIEVYANDLELTLEESSETSITWNSPSERDWEVLEKGSVIKFQAQTNDKVKLQIKAPATSLKSFAKNLKLRASIWMAALYVRSLNSDFQTENSAGKWDIHSLNSNLLIKNHGGNLLLNITNGKSQLVNIKGDLDIEQFAGELFIHDSEGNINVQTQSAKTRVLASTGSFDYQSISGEILLDGFSGSLKGQSENGLSILKPSANTKINWQANQGGLRIGLKKMDGAYVDLATKSGNLNLVAPLKASNEGVWRIARAKMRGSQSGSIRVRTESANIQVKYD